MDDRRTRCSKSRVALLTIVIAVLALLAGGAVFQASARKTATLILLAKTVEKGEGQVFFEPERGGRSIVKLFPVFNTSGNQAVLVIELPAVAITSLRLFPLASPGNYAVDSITLASDALRYRWDNDGVCSQQTHEPAIGPEEICGPAAPLLQAQEDGSIVLTRIPVQGLEQGPVLRGILAVVSALLTLVAGLWLRGAVVTMREGWQQLCIARLLWVAVAVIAVYQLLLICRYGSDAPYFDEWVYFSPEALPAGFSLSWLVSFHNEHRIVFTKLLTWLNLKLFYLDFFKQLVINFGIYLGLLFALVRLVQKSVDLQRFFWFPAFMVFLLSPLNWENHLWAFQSQIHLMFLFSFVALQYAFAEQVSLRSILLFAGFALLAVSSFASGLVITLVSLVMLSLYLVSGMASRRIETAAGVRALAVAWFLVGTGLGLWFYGYPAPTGERLLTLPTDSAFWVYFLSILSYGFGFEVESLIPGIACLLFALLPVVLLLKTRERRQEGATWLLVTAIVALLATLAAISVGRASFSIARHSRYAEFGMLMIPLIAAAWWRALAPGRVRHLVLAFFWIGCCVSFANDWSAGKYQTMRQVNLLNLECIERYYRGVGDGSCSEATPVALDAARSLELNFTRRMNNYNVK